MAQNCSCHGSGEKHSQTVAGLLERPRYSPGLILEDSDLTSAVEYGRSLTRLLFRNLFGCGVICGLLVSVKRDCGLTVTIASGLALDGCGDPIEVPRTVEITLDTAEVEALQDKGPTELWVVLCGKEKMCAPRPVVCDSDDFDGATQHTRIRDHAEVSLSRTPPDCVCGCQRPPKRDVAVSATGGEAELEDECHYLHKNRVECVPDCGCGTACACGCCVLLARVAFTTKDGKLDWYAFNRGHRRFIRPAMLPDPADRETGWESPGVVGTFYWGDMDDSARQEAMDALYPGRRIGSLINYGMVMEMADYTSKQRVLPDAEPAAESERNAEAEKAKPKALKAADKAAADKAAADKAAADKAAADKAAADKAAADKAVKK